MQFLLGAAGVVVVVAALLYGWLRIADARIKAKREEIARNGRRLLAWIVPTVLREMDDFWLVMVIFTFDDSISDPKGFLESVSRRMMALNQQEGSAEERNIARLIDTMDSFELYTARIALPDSLTDGRRVYCTKTYARKQFLPDGALKLPYIFVQVHPEIHDVKAEMVAYPALV